MLFDGVKDEDGCTEDGASTTLEKDTNPVNASNAELKAYINKKRAEANASITYDSALTQILPMIVIE